MIQARQSCTPFIPSKGNALSNIISSAFVRDGRAVLLMSMSPFLADKRLITRTLGLGIAMEADAPGK